MIKKSYREKDFFSREAWALCTEDEKKKLLEETKKELALKRFSTSILVNENVEKSVEFIKKLSPEEYTTRRMDCAKREAMAIIEERKLNRHSFLIYEWMFHGSFALKDYCSINLSNEANTRLDEVRLANLFIEAYNNLSEYDGLFNTFQLGEILRDEMSSLEEKYILDMEDEVKRRNLIL